MEGPKAAQPTLTPAQPQLSPPTPPSQPLPPQPLSFNSKKRPLPTHSPSHNSKRLKLRLLLKGLRPHFIEVLRTPDFRKCRAANEIQEQLKHVVELCKQAISEANSSWKKNVNERRPSSGENKDGQNQQEKPQNVSSDQQEKAQPEFGEIKGTYVVGGSAFGWNFVTFSSKDPVYYGITKESFRAAKLITP
ncbi:uncharacterized protein LOC133796703 [Humulus lupulus]|uniref:uncharacterized protein LOC133796703 n=1 Tax=Humulus lupulus TaxID=3486 RepID=UPI002B4006A0|nr:uncharacterized protein LOC133796703 [Humulus lupulus]